MSCLISNALGEQRAAALAFVNGIEMSSHLNPEVSAHLLAVTPTCHFLEYVDWADKIVQEPLQIVEGAAIVRDRPGTGLIWDADAVQHYRLT
jgi:mandelate racemase